MYLLFIVLTILYRSIVGEATYFTYCAEKGPCPNNDKECSYICINAYGFPRGGFCNTYDGLCCCRGGY
jgi:hypothetical protein